MKIQRADVGAAREPQLLLPRCARDAAELAILVDIASHGFASWLWYGAVIKGEVDTAMERGRARMAEDTLDDGWKNASIAEIDGETGRA